MREAGSKDRMMLKEGEHLHSKVRSLSAIKARKGRVKERGRERQVKGREREEGPLLSMCKQNVEHQLKAAKRLLSVPSFHRWGGREWMMLCSALKIPTLAALIILKQNFKQHRTKT